MKRILEDNYKGLYGANFNVLIKTIEKHQKLYGVSILLCCFIFAYLPFFIYAPFPRVGWDSFSYYYLAEHIFRLDFPVTNMSIDLPVGYSIFLAIAKVFSLNIIHITFIHTLLFFLSCCFLTINTPSYFRFGSILSAIALVIFILQPLTIHFNFKIFVDSFYTSSLIFIVGCVFRYYKSGSLFSFFLILLGVMFACLLRGNGIVMYIVPVLIIIFNFYNKKKVLSLLVLFFSFLLINSLINYIVKGYFFPGDKERISFIYRYNANKEKTVDNPQLLIIKKDMYKKYLKNFSAHNYPNFYSWVLPYSYIHIVEARMDLDTTLRTFRGELVNELNPKLVSIVFEGYDFEKYKEKEYFGNINFNYPERHGFRNTNKWIYANYWLTEKMRKMKINVFIYWIFWLGLKLFLILNIYKLFKSKTIDFLAFVLLLIVFIHLLSLLILPHIHGRFLPRYIYPTEFIVYLSAALLTSYIIKASKFTK